MATSGGSSGGGTANPSVVRIEDGLGNALVSVSGLDSDFAGANGLAVAAMLSAHQAGGPNRLFTSDGLVDGRSGARELAVDLGLFNETTFDRQRNNTQGTLLASAARTVTTSSPDLTSYNSRSLIVFVVVTALASSGAPALRVVVSGKDPGGTYHALHNVESANITAVGSFHFIVGQGEGAAAAATQATTVDVSTFLGYVPAPVPRTFRVSLQANDASTFTYAAYYALVN